MSRYRNGLVLSIESNEVAEIDLTEDSLNESYLASAQAGVDINAKVVDAQNDVQSINETYTAVNELEAIQNTLDGAIESGDGLDAKAAEVAEIAVEAICRRVGIYDRIMLSHESFSSHGRMQATRLSTEAISETLGRIASAIVSAVKKVFSKFKEILKDIKAAFTTTRNHLKQMLAQANSLSNDVQPKESELKDKTLAKKFSQKGVANMRTAIRHNEVSLELSNEVNKIVIEYSRKLTTLLNSTDLKNSSKILQMDYMEQIRNFISKKSATSKHREGRNFSEYGYGVFYDNKEIWFTQHEAQDISYTIPITDGKGNTSFIHHSEHVAPYTEVRLHDSEQGVATTITALNKKEVINLLTYATSAIDEYDKAIDLVQRSYDAIDVTSKAANTYADSWSEDNDRIKVAKAVLKQTEYFLVNGGDLIITLYSSVWNTIQGMEKYAYSSLKNLKAE